ncbi:MAG: hypothetical protein QF600_06090 [Verrucomicrobiota bacterium]|nr:hypothetical protein [Verrucomicrobiota bacterium]
MRTHHTLSTLALLVAATLIHPLHATRRSPRDLMDTTHHLQPNVCDRTYAE